MKIGRPVVGRGMVVAAAGDGPPRSPGWLGRHPRRPPPGTAARSGWNMPTFHELAERFRLFVKHPDKADDRAVRDTAIVAAKLFMQHVRQRKPGIFQVVDPRIVSGFDTLDGTTSDRFWVFIWNDVAMNSLTKIEGYKNQFCSSDAIGGSDYHALPVRRLDGTIVNKPKLKYGVQVWPKKRWLQRAIDYAVACDILAEEAEEISKKRPGHKGRRRTRATTEHPLTDRQRQALGLWSKYNGKVTDVAREMGITHPTASQHIKAAWRKIPSLAPKKTSPAGKPRALPTDRRGQPNL